MGACTGVVRGVEKIVQRRRLKVARVVVFHGLEVQIGGLSDPAIPSTKPATEHRAGNVGAMPRMLVGRRAISNHVVISDHASPKVAMVLVQTGICDTYDLP